MASSSFNTCNCHDPFVCYRLPSLCMNPTLPRFPGRQPLRPRTRAESIRLLSFQGVDPGFAYAHGLSVGNVYQRDENDNMVLTHNYFVREAVRGRQVNYNSAVSPINYRRRRGDLDERQEFFARQSLQATERIIYSSLRPISRQRSPSITNEMDDSPFLESQLTTGEDERSWASAIGSLRSPAYLGDTAAHQAFPEAPSDTEATDAASESTIDHLQGRIDDDAAEMDQLAARLHEGSSEDRERRLQSLAVYHPIASRALRLALEDAMHANNGRRRIESHPGYQARSSGRR